MHRLRLAPLLALPLLGCATVTPRSAEPDPRIRELETENATLREEIRTLRKRLEVVVRSDSVSSGPIAPRDYSFPSIDGQILDVAADGGRVVLDRGARDGVKVGYTFHVYLGATYKGQVRVREVQETTCSAEILSRKNPISRGDTASTNL